MCLRLPTQGCLQGGALPLRGYKWPNMNARNKHLSVSISESEVVHFNWRVKMFLFLMLAVPPFFTKILSGIWAWYSTGP